jgi:hypothetical protein
VLINMFKYRAVNNLAVTQDLEVDVDLDVKNMIDCVILNTSTINATTSNITNSNVTNLDVTGDIGVGTTTPAARLHIINTENRDCFRVDDQASDTTVFAINASGQVAIGMAPNTIFPSAAFAVVSNNKGLLPPSMTQATKLTISEPAGLTVYDETIGTPSYYTNNFNWFIPAWIKFGLTSNVTTQGNISWTIAENDDSSRLTHSAGTFTIKDIGNYIVLCSATFFNPSGTIGSGEREIRIVLTDLQASTTVVAASTSLCIVESSLTAVFANASISYMLNTTAVNRTYRFSFSSNNDQTIDLSASSHGMIYRIG